METAPWLTTAFKQPPQVACAESAAANERRLLAALDDYKPARDAAPRAALGEANAALASKGAELPALTADNMYAPLAALEDQQQQQQQQQQPPPHVVFVMDTCCAKGAHGEGPETYTAATGASYSYPIMQARGVDAPVIVVGRLRPFDVGAGTLQSRARLARPHPVAPPPHQVLRRGVEQGGGIVVSMSALTRHLSERRCAQLPAGHGPGGGGAAGVVAPADGGGGGAVPPSDDCPASSLFTSEPFQQARCRMLARLALAPAARPPPARPAQPPNNNARTPRRRRRPRSASPYGGSPQSRPARLCGASSRARAPSASRARCWTRRGLRRWT